MKFSRSSIRLPVATVRPSDASGFSSRHPSAVFSENVVFGASGASPMNTTGKLWALMLPPLISVLLLALM
jgi:hypothetical protein